MNSELYSRIGALAKKHRDYPNVYNPKDPDNKTILIEKNMRLAVNVALKYRGMGVEEDDLIGAALLGLSVAYDKYKPEQSVLKDRLLGLINDTTTADDFIQIITDNMPYSDNVGEMFANGVPDTPDEMVKWVNRNIRPAKFTSVAQMWIKAYILAQLEKYGTPVRGADGNAFDYLDDEETMGIDRLPLPVANDDETEEREEAWEKLFTGVPEHCRRIIEQRYGIGVDEPMTLKEIAGYWGRDIQYVKRTIADCTERLKDNAQRYGLDLARML